MVMGEGEWLLQAESEHQPAFLKGVGVEPVERCRACPRKSLDSLASSAQSVGAQFTRTGISAELDA